MERGTFAQRQVMSRVDQKDVRERLREIAELAFEMRIILLRQQPDVIAKPK
jgi:hypothetical protein